MAHIAAIADGSGYDRDWLAWGGPLSTERSPGGGEFVSAGKRTTPGQVDVPPSNELVTHIRKRRHVRGFRPYLVTLPQIAA